MKKILPHNIKVASILALIALFGFGCSKSSDTHTLATVLTNSIMADVTLTTATSGGSITDVGSDVITATGVCYSATSQSPTIADKHTSDNTTTNGYTSSLTDLTPGTVYYVRAYATNAAGTAYGGTLKFTTATAGNATIATVSTFAGNSTGGLVNATGTAAQFYSPQGMAVDAQGNMYVCDQFNHVIRKVTPAGAVTTFCGDGNLGHADGPATSAEFYSPNALALDAQGNVYVADQGNNLIVKITPAGVATTIAGNGTASYVDAAIGTNATFNAPKGIAVDKTGNIFVADSRNNRVRKISTTGVVSTFAGSGQANFFDGAGIAAIFNGPNALAFDSKGNLFVGDYNNHAIRKITTDGTVTTFAGTPLQPGLVGNPLAIAFDTSDNLYIADGAGRVSRYLVSTNVLNSLAGTAAVYGFADGIGTAAQFNTPAGVAIFGGSIFVADYNNNRIRKIVVNN